MSRSLAVVAAFVLCTLAGIAAPAWACGCGGYVPDVAGPRVVDEKALVRWDGTTEDIVMGLGVDGTSEKAAWIMPVPVPAEITLADPAVFEELAEVTKPRIDYEDRWWPRIPFPMLGAGGGGAPGADRQAVQVRGQQRLGPLEITRLAATDPKALTTWLGRQGFPSAPKLESGLAYYVEAGWEIVAVKLVAAEGKGLGGELQPLRLTFPTTKPIYPMRLSQGANHPIAVSLYVLADHRMTYESGKVPKFAGPVRAGRDKPALSPFLGGDGMFLSHYTATYENPRLITEDFAFVQAADDTRYQQHLTVVRDRFAYVGPLAFLVLVLLAVGLVVGSVLRRRARMAR